MPQPTVLKMAAWWGKFIVANPQSHARNSCKYHGSFSSKGWLTGYQINKLMGQPRSHLTAPGTRMTATGNIRKLHRRETWVGVSYAWASCRLHMLGMDADSSSVE